MPEWSVSAVEYLLRHKNPFMKIFSRRAADTELVPLCWTDQHRIHDGLRNDSAYLGAPGAAGSAKDSAAAPTEPVSQAGLLTYAVDVSSSRQSSAERPSMPVASSTADANRADAQLHHGQPRQTDNSPSASEAGDCASECVAHMPAKERAADRPSPEQAAQQRQKQQQQRQRQKQDVWYRSWEVCQSVCLVQLPTS